MSSQVPLSCPRAVGTSLLRTRYSCLGRRYFRGIVSQAPDAIYGISPCEGLRQVVMNCPDEFSCASKQARALPPNRQQM